MHVPVATSLNAKDAILDNKNATKFEFLKEDIANRKGIEKILLSKRSYL